MSNITSEVLLYNCTSSTKGGHKVTLQVTDRETIDQLEAIGLGKLFMMVLAPIADDGQPVKDLTWPKPKRQTYSQRAALMLQDERFRDLVAADFDTHLHSAEEANDWLLRYCGIGRKRTLDDEQMRQERQSFLDLETAFKIWTGEISGPGDNY